MRRLYKDRLDDHLGKLANHFGRSNNPEKAVHYLRLAGAQAAQRSVEREAAAHFRLALELVRTLPSSSDRMTRELDLLVMLGPVAMTIGGYASPEPIEVYSRAIELATRMGDDARLFPSVWGLWMSSNQRAESDQARELMGKLLSAAEVLDDDKFRIEAHHAARNTLMFRGDLLEAKKHIQLGAALYNPHEHDSLLSLFGAHDPAVCAGYHSAIIWWLLGYPDRAAKCGDDAIATAHQIGHSNTLTSALGMVSLVTQLSGNWGACREFSDEAIEIASRHGNTYWSTFASIVKNSVVAQDGLSERELTAMRDALAQHQAGGAHSLGSHFLGLIAAICARLGRVEEALELTGAAIGVSRRTGERWIEADLLRQKGELMLRGDANATHESETHFRAAIGIARAQDAKSWELRATMSLARLLAKQDKREEARGMLAEIYNWFTEGFDTRDLIDAKALLDELS